MARSRVDAKWKDSSQIKEYMRSYLVKNRKRLNQLSAERERRNWGNGKKKQLNAFRRALKLGAIASLTNSEWLEILDRFNGKCAACGTSQRIEQDHIIPLTKGGHHTRDNIQPLCRSCNASKGAKTAQYGILILET